MRQGISVEYVRYLTGRRMSVLAYGRTAHFFRFVSPCGGFYELILLGVDDTPEAVQNLVAFLIG